MAKHRTLVPVSYIEDGAVVSVAADRTIELSDNQAAPLAGKVVLIEWADSMFPDGSPIIPEHLVHPHPSTSEVELEPLREVKKPK